MYKESTEAPKLLELSIEYDRNSVIYAKNHFTLYISVENKSQKKITLWDFNIMGSSEFYLQTFFKKTGYVEGLPAGTWGTKFTRFYCSIITFLKGLFEPCRNNDEPEYYDEYQKNPSEETLKKRARKDILKEHYYSRLKKPIINKLPWQLLPGERHTVNFDVETHHSWSFNPGTYKLNLYADYSIIENKFLFCWDAISKNDTTLLKDFLLTDYKIDWIKDANIEKIDCDMAIIAKSKDLKNSLTLRLNETKTKVFLENDKCYIGQLTATDENGKLNIYGINEEFARITKIEKVEVLVPLGTLMWGGVFGATLGVTARILLKSLDKNIMGILSWTFVAEIFVSIILSILAVTALARRTGTQTIITIQDFWGGLFIGFMAGYAGHNYVDKLLGIGPGEILTNQTENVTNQINSSIKNPNNY